MSTLYLVATPIGNLEDISARALRVLNQVCLIAAEDTRRTGKLLKHYQIQTRLTSYHEHSEDSKIDLIIGTLAEGDAALVSDAGTPVLNDPGYKLVRAVLDAGYQVSPIPGPSAPIAALVASGIACDSFLYLGYMPRKEKERRNLLQEVREAAHTLIFLESPQRILSSLSDTFKVLGEREIAVARELTKLHEEIYRGTISGAVKHFTNQTPRGEFTIILSGHDKTERKWSLEEVEAELIKRVGKGESASTVAKNVAGISGWSRRDVYNQINNMDIYGVDNKNEPK